MISSLNVDRLTNLSFFDVICYYREREFKVAIKFATSVSMHQLRELLSGKQVETPQEVLSVFDIVLKEVAAQRYIFSIMNCFTISETPTQTRSIEKLVSVSYLMFVYILVLRGCPLCNSIRIIFL